MLKEAPTATDSQSMTSRTANGLDAIYAFTVKVSIGAAATLAVLAVVATVQLGRPRLLVWLAIAVVALAISVNRLGRLRSLRHDVEGDVHLGRGVGHPSRRDHVDA